MRERERPLVNFNSYMRRKMALIAARERIEQLEAELKACQEALRVAKNAQEFEHACSQTVIKESAETLRLAYTLQGEVAALKHDNALKTHEIEFLLKERIGALSVDTS